MTIPDATADSSAATINALWRRHGPLVLRWGTPLLALAAAAWLSYEFWRLLFQPGYWGAIDLGARYLEVNHWFAGFAVYWIYVPAVYPPATYAMLWPFLGWIPSFGAVRWLWGVIAVVLIARLSLLTVRETGASTGAERRFVALLPLGTYALGAGIGNGQIIVTLVVVLLMQLPAQLERARREATWASDLRLTLAFIACLVKPSLSAPFFWLVLLVPRRVRPAALIVAGYAALTLVSAAFQPVPPLELMRRWFEHGERGLENGALRLGYGSLNDVLLWLQLPNLDAVGSLVILGLFGLWVWRRRDASPWLLVGVAAVVSRLWMYHNWYDDLILLPALVPLYRLARNRLNLPTVSRTAGVLLGALIILSVAPGGHYVLPEPLRSLYLATLTLIWIAIMVWLARQARRVAPAV